MASNLWVFSEQFSGLFSYSDLREKQMDKTVVEIITTLIENHYSDTNFEQIEQDLVTKLNEIISKKANHSFDNLSRSLEAEIDTAFNI